MVGHGPVPRPQREAVGSPGGARWHGCERSAAADGETQSNATRHLPSSLSAVARRWCRRVGRGPDGPAPARCELTVVGDLMLTRGVPDPAAALAPMSPMLRSADLTVGNLESTLSTRGDTDPGRRLVRG